MPLISVIVPVYKVEPYLHRCVDSILAQTFTDFELILVDDGSPDNCPTICDEYAKKDSRVHVIHQKNGGLSAARNAGIDWAFANSDSEWLNFVDSDDWVHPEYLERLLDAALENNVSVSICGYAKTQGEEPEINKDDFLPQIWTPEEFYVERTPYAIVAFGKIYRKKCFKEIRYPVGKIHEDEFTTYRILFQEQKISFIAGKMYCYFQNEDGITHSPWTPNRMDGIEAIREEISFFEEYGFERAYIKEIWVMLWTITSQIQQINHDKANHRSCKKLRKMLRTELKKNRRTLGLTIKNNCCFYEAAYPSFMTIYWYGQATMKKLHIKK